jgi:hypothetical protein
MGGGSAMRRNLILAFCIFAATISLSPLCKTPAVKPEAKPQIEPLPQEAVIYLDALAAFNKTEGRRSMEPLYTAATIAADTLIMGNGDQKSSYVERINDKTFAAIREKLTGLEVWIGSDTFGAGPDLDFFLDLAHKRGLDADIAFFTLLKAQSDGVDPIYFYRAWDFGGCVKYGSLLLTEGYSKWSKFRKQFPQSYIEESSGKMRDIEYDIMHGIDSCGGKDDVMREFRAFFKQVDDPDLETALLKRMGDIENGTSGMRYNQFFGVAKKEPEPLPPPVTEYIDALETFKKAEGAMSTEPLYNLAWNAAEAMMTSYSDKQPPYIMRVNDQVFASIQEKLPGLVLVRDSEDFRIYTDDEYFMKISLEKGSKADIDFFSLQVQQSKDGCPNYTDSGCIKYGSLILVDNYSKWLNYRKKYPECYMDETQRELFSIRIHFLDGYNLCSCHGSKEVLKEFRVFLKMVDDPALKEAVRWHIGKIEKGTSKIKFNCK